MPLDVERVVLKPYEYPWAFEAWEAQHQAHWLPESVPLADDVKDWHMTELNDKGELVPYITEGEKNLVTQIFRFFTQSDVEVNNCYHRVYLNTFKVPEVLMMLTAFSDMETIHVVSYSHLLDTIGMPEVEYQAFLEYTEMKDKFDYMRSHLEGKKDAESIAETLAVFGAFTEGLQLFASFAILMNFPRFNKLKGMGQIVTYSARDETLHCLSLIRLFHQWVLEHPEIDKKRLEKKILDACISIVEHEDKFIDLAFEQGDVEGLSAALVKEYIRYMADVRLEQLGYKPYYGVSKNPLPWMDAMLNAVEFAAFFEQKSTEYTKSATKGEWQDVWASKPSKPKEDNGWKEKWDEIE